MIIAKSNQIAIVFCPAKALCSISAPYVIGKMYDNGLRKKGNFSIGKNSPQRKIIGNLKKLEKVCASKTSLTETAINKPKKVDDIAIKIIAGINIIQIIPERSAKNSAIIIGINAFNIPKIIAPDVLASINKFNGIGANSNLSNDLLLFSNVTVTASMEVVPKRIDTATTPGRIFGILSKPEPDLMKNIPVHANGKTNPQLMFGGFI